MSRKTWVFFAIPLVLLAWKQSTAEDSSGPLLAPPLAKPTDTEAQSKGPELVPPGQSVLVRSEKPEAIGVPPQTAVAEREQFPLLAETLEELLVDAIPRDYEKKKEWGRQKSITTGIRADPDGLRLRLFRRKKKVDHGTWKHYRIRLADPQDSWRVAIHELRSLKPGTAAITLQIEGDISGWARARMYNRGLHLGTYTVEADSRVRLTLAMEISVRIEPIAPLPALVLEPVVRSAELRLDEFQMHRLSKLRGPLIRELGKGFKEVLEEDLDSAKLTKKLNRSIAKKADRLRFDPNEAWATNWKPVLEVAQAESAAAVAPQQTGPEILPPTNTDSSPVKSNSGR